ALRAGDRFRADLASREAHEAFGARAEEGVPAAVRDQEPIAGGVRITKGCQDWDGVRGANERDADRASEDRLGEGPLAYPVEREAHGVDPCLTVPCVGRPRLRGSL